MCWHISDKATHLQVFLRSLLPLLGHGARPDGAGEHARESEDGESTGDDGRGQEEDIAALIRRRGSAWAVGAESNKVCYIVRIMSAHCPYRRVPGISR